MNTLLSYHKNKINEFDNYEKDNKKIKKKINSLKKQIGNLEKVDYSKLTTEEIKKLFTLRDQLVNEEKKIKNSKDEKNKYQLKIFNCLIDYHNISISKNNSDTDMISPPCEKIFIDKKKDNKKDIFESFLEIVETDYIVQKQNDDLEILCNNCSESMKLNYTLSQYICENCGTIKQDIFMINEKKSNYSSFCDTNNFSYKRISHFIEWLNNLQGKSKNNISENDLLIIKKEIKRLKINERNISKKIMKRVLEKINLSKHNDQINYIIKCVSNKKFPVFSKSLENTMITMFKKVQEPFEKHCPKNRSNFLNYSYCIIKFLELLNQDQYIKYIDKLKSRDKIYAQEQIWKNICKELKWEFIPSI